ncbi:MAG: amino acid adenylation domain-containing protein, partial [Gammaproteobacteria bacterium]
MGGPKDIAYNLPEVLRFDGVLEPQQVQDAIRTVIRRHEILRTAFVFSLEDGEIYQEVHAAVPFEIDHVALETEQFDAWLKDFIRPFNLAVPCQLRCALVNTPQANYLVFDSHHIIGDGFSAGIINTELAQLCQGRQLPEPRFQYLDHVDWSARWMSTPHFRKQQQYWLDALSGPVPVLDLPLDFDRPERKDFLGSTVEFSLGAHSAPLRALFRAHTVTLFTGLLSVYAIFLAKLARQDEVFIATPVTGRPLPDMQQLPGMFVNTLPIITRPRSDLNFADFLQAVKGAVLGCLEHAHCDISTIVEKLGIKRNASRNPLFDTLFVLQVKNLDMFDDTGMGFTPHAFDRQRSQFDLSLEAVERGEEIVFKLDYATALFSRPTVLQFRDQLLQLVANLLAAPSARIGDLSLLSRAQEQSLIHWCSPLEETGMASIPALFDASAARHAGKPALVLGDQSLSYGELARRVDNLAWHLRQAGVGRNDFVALMLERSFEMIVAILAVIKAGAAYVPIDPDYPDDRVRFAIEDCAPKLLISQPEVVTAKAALLAALPVRLIEDIAPYLDGEHRLAPVNAAADLMYLIYTSGTTGLPKGVMVEHRCLLALLKGNSKLHFAPEDRWALFHSYAFDVSVWEIFASLLHGCTLVIVPKKTTRDTSAFWRLLQEQQVTVLNQTPSAFYRFAEVDAAQEACLPIRWVNFAGEALLPGRLAGWRAKYPATELINMYGITETTVHTTYKNLSDADIANGQCSNIGVALDSLYIYLLDKDMKLCAPGVIGEIYVGGWGVARGYLNRPQLNAERFLDDPFVPGRRLYRSGDLAKWTAAGELEYLGRNDQQVKIRGFRIECGEIENCLIKTSGARAAAVFDKLDAHGDKYLCAVVQGLDMNEETAAGLKRALADFLPGYMIPTHIVAIDEIPLTSNGKLDRRALAAHMDRCAPSITYVAPEGPTETALARIWARFFPTVQAIGRAHDFFELGGHSLLAIEMALDIKKTFDKTVLLETLFNHSTLAELAAQIDLAGAAGAEAPIAPIARAPAQPYYEASSAQQRLFFLQELTSEPGIAYNVPLAYAFEGAIDLDALRRHLTCLVERHEALRTTFCLVDGVLKQRIGTADDFTLEVEDQADTDVRACVGRFVRPFDLRRDLPFRARVVRSGGDCARGLLLLDFHHIICDGMSLNIVSGELTQLFLGQPLRPAPLQFKDFSSWWPGHPRQGPDLDYWLGQLQGAPRLDLFTDRARAPVPSFAGDELVWTLPQGEQARIDAFCKRHKITAHMAYLAVFSLLLSKLSGQRDVVIGSPFAGRLHRDLQETVGMFVGSMPIRCRPHGGMAFEEFVQRVRATCLEAQDHQHVQFEELARRLGAHQDAARNPIFDCMLDIQVADPQALRMPGVRLDPIRLNNPSAKMDLLLSIGSVGGGAQGDARHAGAAPVTLTFSYATALFERATIETMARSFQVLLGQCLDAPTRALDELFIGADGDPAPERLFARADNRQRIAAWYWQRQLASWPEALALPAEPVQVQVPGQARASHPVTLEAGLGAALAALGRRHGASLEVTLLCGWAALLARLSGQDELLVGPLRFRFASADTVAQLLAQGRRLHAEAAPHLHGAPATQTLFRWHGVPNADPACELVLSLSEADGRISGELSYDGARHDAASIARHVRHFGTLLAAMAEDGDALLATLPLLDAAERRQILLDWQGVQTPAPHDDCIHELFERQAARTPEAVAVVCGARQLSYAELDAQTNQLARHLRASGAGRDTLVALCLERGIEMVVALLATLKAGAAYLPLDPAYPQERLAGMLADSAPVALITHAPTAALLAPLAPGLARIDLDAPAAPWRSAPSHPLGDADGAGHDPSQLAYVIYTSGSTGKPKGIAVEHRSASNLAASLLRQVYGNPTSLAGKRVGLNASIAFDASLQQLLMLNYGATLHVLPADVRLDMDALAAALGAWQLDALDITPAQLALLLSSHPGLQLPAYLLVGGDAIDPALWATLQEHTESAIFNVYGPTETTVDSILCNIHLAGPRPVLGRPLDNTRVYILDDHLQPVPVGVAGELHIGGAGVARGYLNRPELTAERFLSDPFCAQPGERIYKTGDLARWRADGSIDYLGRNDFQVKIRGFRIELGEIEARLAALATVREAVVVAREAGGGDKRLVAYLVMQPGEVADAAALRAALAADLADYMLPAAFVQLAAMPLTPNGKLDRKALPAPADDAYASQRYEAPEGELEAALAALWSGVLQRERIGRHDNFFELGGHSLLAVQLLSRIREQLRREVTLAELFSHPTLAGFAAVLGRAGQTVLPAIVPAERDGPLALSFAQQRLWFLSKMDGVSQAYHISGGIRLSGAVDVAALRAALDRIVARHEALRTTFHEHDGQALGGDDAQVATRGHDTGQGRQGGLWVVDHL